MLLAALAAAPFLSSDIAQGMLALLHNHPYFFYFVLVCLGCGEGPILSVICGTLIKLGYFAFWPVYLALMVGDLIGDIGWYAVGYFFGHSFVKRFGHRFGVNARTVHRVSKVFNKHRHKIILINKLTMGFGFSLATLITAGIARIPFGQYLVVNSLGQLIWTGALLALGYYVGHAYVYISDVFGVLGDAGLVATFLLIAYALHRYRQYMAASANSRNSFMGIALGGA